jgi:hypothetical protein
MKKLTPVLPILFILSLLLMPSCEETHRCDENSYEKPEIQLVDPSDGKIIIPWNGPAEFTVSLDAEAGLNTLALAHNQYGDEYEDGIHVFTNGETEGNFTFQLQYWGDGQASLVVYDLCNQKRSVDVVIEYEPAPDK